MRYFVFVMIIAFVKCASGAEINIKSQPYAEAGLVCRPLVPQEGDTVTFTVRTTVTGELTTAVPASFELVGPNNKKLISETLTLAQKQGLAEASVTWKAVKNGVYRAKVAIDPDRTIDQVNRDDDQAAFLVPVVVKGRRLFFPWYAERSWLRWANVWAGGTNKENVEQWAERGVLSLRWKWGNNLPDEKADAETFSALYSDSGGCPGIAIDEFGYYPTTPRIARFNVALAGLERARKERPEQFVLAWHCGTLYPQQAALYRSATDLVVLESYVFYYAPKNLKTDHIYDLIDMKMLPGRQADALAGPPTSTTTIITSVDLVPDHFDRGEMEQVVRHMRRRWPEMRGFGIYGGLVKEDQEASEDYADEKFVDRLCYEYFIQPVVTFLPQSVWVTRGDKETYLTAAISNIGGMDSGSVRVQFTDNGQSVGEASVASVPAGDSRLTNRSLVQVRWQPEPGPHRIEARILEAQDGKVLDNAMWTDYFW